MHRAGAAVGVEDEVARVVAATDRQLAERVGHACVDYFADTCGRIDHADAQRLGDLGADCFLSGGLVDRHPAAEEVVRVDDTEHDVGIGNRHLGATALVADGTGIGSGAIGADAQRAVDDGGD
ncbi:Uncharacterised protein [Mycobacteroides abscessus subsp. abscessus]|nr:Uncharacterised protein [Mycobacteroides abscessus subsp. abscessus]